MGNKVILIGFSGHAWVLAEMAQMQGYELVGYTEIKTIEVTGDAIKRAGWLQLPYLGNEMDADFQFDASCSHLLAVGDNGIRRKIFQKLTSNGMETVTLVAKTAMIKPSAEIGSGTVVMEGAIVQTLAKIGDAVIINSGAIIEHECVIGDFAHIAPGAVLAGNVSVGNGSFIGANAVVKQGVKIGENVIIGAGSVVLKDVADSTIVVGNPAKELKK